MTRFARAKGSKASNLKAPEDSTPWEVMKEHMLKAKKENEDSKNREEAEQQRIENYNNFLKEHRVQKRKATWCDFPETESIKNSKIVKETIKNKSKKEKNEKEKRVNSSEVSLNTNNNSNNDTYMHNDKESEGPRKKKKKHNKNKTASDQQHKSKEGGVLPLEQNLSIKEEKKKGKKKKQKSEGEITNNDTSANTDTKNISNSTSGSVKKGKNKQNKTQSHTDNAKNNQSDITEIDNPNKHSESNKVKNNQVKNSKAKRRKPINDKSFQLIINGKEVKLVRFDGFPIMKKDAERLEELKKSMINKGIPKSEVQRTMKLERRRAEKALARMKREVCYNCRKGGHNLSDCPDLKSNIPGVDSAEGVCFKCGSTEHRQFECKVQRDKEFRFATCFICKESGHIARQCPDNPKGLYPNGGCCKLCGDVTHLRKDCPTVNNKKEETTFKLQTLNDDNIEDLGYQPKPVSEGSVKKPKKIKF